MFELSFRPLKTILSIIFFVNFSLFSEPSKKNNRPAVSPNIGKSRQNHQVSKKRKFLAAAGGFAATSLVMGVGKLIYDKFGTKDPIPASFDIDGLISKILKTSGITDPTKLNDLTLLLNHKITMVFSQLVGDALGAPIEIVGKPASGYSRLTPDNVSDMKPGAKISGISSRTAGEFTDDGSMMLALLAAFSKIIEYGLEWILELGNDKPSPLPSIVMYEFWKLMIQGGEHACPSCVNSTNTFTSQKQLFWNTIYSDGKAGPTIMLTQKPSLSIKSVQLIKDLDNSFLVQITFKDGSTHVSKNFSTSWNLVRDDGAIPSQIVQTYLPATFVPAGYAIKDSVIYFDKFVMPWVKNYLLKDGFVPPTTDQQIITFLATYSYPQQQLWDNVANVVSPKKKYIWPQSQRILQQAQQPSDFENRLQQCAYPPLNLNSESVTNGCLMRGAGVQVVSDNEDQIINLANEQTKATHTSFGCTSLGKVYSKFVNHVMHCRLKSQFDFQQKATIVNAFAEAMFEDQELRHSAAVHGYLYPMMKYLSSIHTSQELLKLRMAKWTTIKNSTPLPKRTATQEWYLNNYETPLLQPTCTKEHVVGEKPTLHWCFGEDTKATTRFDFGYVIPSSGSGAGCIVAAIWAWLAHDNAKDTLLALANLKYDSDTVAAIGGELVGATYEFKDIPINWIDSLGGSSQFNQQFKAKLQLYLETCLAYMIKSKK